MALDTMYSSISRLVRTGPNELKLRYYTLAYRIRISKTRTDWSTNLSKIEALRRRNTVAYRRDNWCVVSFVRIARGRVC